MALSSNILTAYFAFVNPKLETFPLNLPVEANMLEKSLQSLVSELSRSWSNSDAIASMKDRSITLLVAQVTMARVKDLATQNHTGLRRSQKVVSCGENENARQALLVTHTTNISNRLYHIPCR